MADQLTTEVVQHMGFMATERQALMKAVLLFGSPGAAQKMISGIHVGCDRIGTH
jgi:hypothetical protein